MSGVIGGHQGAEMAMGWAHPTTGPNQHHKTGTRLEPPREAHTKPSNHDLEKEEA